MSLWMFCLRMSTICHHFIIYRMRNTSFHIQRLSRTPSYRFIIETELELVQERQCIIVVT